MNKNELVKNLIKNIQDIYSIANRFENPEQIHPIDIDLALSKVRNLYELLLKLNPQAAYTTEYQKEEISTIPKQSTEKIKVTSAQKASEKNEPEQIKQKETKTETIQEQEIVIETPSKKEEIPARPAGGIEKNPVQNKEVEKEVVETNQNGSSPEIVADKFQSKKFVHDSIAKKNIKKDVSSKMQSKSINDINSAIGLNDKFIFIRELFGNDKKHYHETIQVLNNFDIYENAVNFLNENFDWDSDDPNFERLKELVRRKYS
jgi:hypothetical protein